MVSKDDIEKGAVPQIETAKRRPPGALQEREFTDRCTGCFDCIEVCPSQALSMDALMVPYLRPGRTCLHCGLCADVCSHRAIRLTPRTREGLARTLEMEREDGAIWGT